MQQLKHYTALSQSLQDRDPQAFELLDEEIQIILHKLKFIPMESRPMVFLSDDREQSAEQEYLQELLAIGGAQIGLQEVNRGNSDLLIFINPSFSFLSQLPALLNEDYQNSKAVSQNQVYIIQKASFGLNPEELLNDTEIIAEIVQAKYFHFGHEGQDWIKFDL